MIATIWTTADTALSIAAGLGLLAVLLVEVAKVAYGRGIQRGIAHGRAERVRLLRELVPIVRLRWGVDAAQTAIDLADCMERADLELAIEQRRGGGPGAA